MKCPICATNKKISKPPELKPLPRLYVQHNGNRVGKKVCPRCGFIALFDITKKVKVGSTEAIVSVGFG